MRQNVIEGNKLKFVVISPSINPKSAGSMFLYQLSDSIKSLGYEANRVLIRQDSRGHFFVSIDQNNFMPLQTDTLQRYFDPASVVVIHGENLHHKYFDGFNVARFYLNKIGALVNIGVPREGEYRIAWHSSFVENPDFILRKPIIKQSENEVLSLNEPRLIDITYVGKGALYDPSFSRLSGTFELTRRWPDNVDEYLLLLSKTRFLFTFDVNTSVVEEAIVYGVMPVLMTCKPKSSMDEVFESYDKELADCCLVFDKYKVITDENFDTFANNFFNKRKKFISYLDRQRSSYPENLANLLAALHDRFATVSHEPR